LQNKEKQIGLENRRDNGKIFYDGNAQRSACCLFFEEGTEPTDEQ
jgi:hypothetical protein